ncbi:Retrovirus-related Pol polyprotein from transposon RE1-like protein [Drosera capensis]
MTHFSTSISTNGLSSQELQFLRGLLSRSTHITTCWKKHEYPDQSPTPSARQDLRTQAVMGESREAQGLYHLNAPPTALSAVSNPPLVSASTPAPVPAPVPAYAPLQTYARRVKQTIDKALWENDTWDVVPTPLGQSCVSCRWIYTIKHNPDGSIERLKPRLVARGLPNSMLDIKNAFLHGDLTETVYILQPPMYETAGENHVCRLHKSMYRLKQSPRAWFEKFSMVVQDIGFSRRSADSSLFGHLCSQGTVILLVYVDDIIITGDDTAGITKMISHLSNQFHTKDLGTLKYFLGIEIVKYGKSLFLNQRKYCLDILKESGFLGCKLVDTPIEQNLKLSNFTDE